MLIACFNGMCLEKKVWPNSDLDLHEFQPERFIRDGKVVIPDRHNPFGVGKRRCMGEMMARANIFLFMTTLLQQFTFKVPAGHPIPTDVPIDGATASVQQYTAYVVNR